MHLRKLSFDQLVRVAAVRGRLIEKIEQTPDVGQPDVERSTVPYESESFDVLSPVSPIPVGFARGFAQQPLALVEPNRFHVDPGGRRDFADAHDLLLDSVATTGFRIVLVKEDAIHASCCDAPSASASTGPYRRALWIALAVNLVMFVVEFGSSVPADSASLLADAIDFGGDAANYGLSLGALALGLRSQSRAAFVKGLSMSVYGAAVIALAAWRVFLGSGPQPVTMGIVGAFALAANVGVALLLYAHRDGNANMRSVWRCSRNDAAGNLAVMLAALGVFGTGSRYPDLVVAVVIASLALVSGTATVREARRELRDSATRCSAA